MRIVRARIGLRGVRWGEEGHPGPLKLVLRGVSQQNMVSDASGVDPTLLDALEKGFQETQVDGQEPMRSPSEGVLKFNLTQADSASSSST